MDDQRGGVLNVLKEDMQEVGAREDEVFDQSKPYMENPV